eukprot:TRINITY_DN1892_c0_g1_i1.p1 TRINITY_DN1892_c0_g1~~TRINITY_DN1892_c0_g1_i1.p1  ORF type:complete len:596 (-),score=139.43 TRINITY_DN1892_c0_g1_i1:61-1848(-)
MTIKAIVSLCTLGLASSAASCEDGLCAASDFDAAPAANDETDSLKVSLLQTRTNAALKSLGSEMSEEPALAKRREALLQELSEIDAELDREDAWMDADAESELEAEEAQEQESDAEAGTEEELFAMQDVYEKAWLDASDAKQDVDGATGRRWQWGNADCSTYFCGSKYLAGRNCQCNADCEKYDSCCDDYKSLCTSGCAERGCGKYKKGAKCQCTSACKKYGNCCDDYVQSCVRKPSQHPTPAPTTKAPTPRPTPAPTTAAPTPAGSGATAGHKGIFGHPSTTIKYPEYEGFTLLLAEEFEEPIDLDNDPIWTWSDGGLREGSVRFVKEQVKFEDGVMKIEVSNKKPYPRMESCSMAAVEHIPHKPYVSGELRSRYNMFRYGRYEARIKAPQIQPGKPEVNGNFITTMFVYRDANAHHWREIDFEITGDKPDSLTTNLLFADGTKNWQPDLQDSRQYNLQKVISSDLNVRGDFHTYMFEWIPSGVTWYVDGKVVRKGSPKPVPELSTKIMINIWIFTGYAFGGPEGHNNRYPFHGEYDYFRFYKWNNETTYPCADFSTKCLTKDDMYLTANNPCDGIEQVGLLEGAKPCVATCRK